MKAQQFLRSCHRANASLKCCSEISDRAGPLPGMGHDSSDGRERIFDAMVKFGNELILLLFSVLSLGDITDSDTDHTVRIGLDRAAADLDRDLAPALCYGKRLKLGAGRTSCHSGAKMSVQEHPDRLVDEFAR